MKILIIGSGPAGTSAAIKASSSGNEVVLLEKNSRPGVKACAEGLGNEALDFLGLQPSKNFIISETKGFRISYKGKFIREAPFRDYPCCPRYVVNKQLLLEAGLAKAECNGAKIRFSTRVKRADPETGRVELDGGSTERGDLIICADGLGSVAREHLDYSGYDVATCLQYRCRLPKDIDPDYLYLDIIGEGYAWIFPKGDRANIGAGLPNSSAEVRQLRTYLDRFIKKLGVEPIGNICGAPVSVGGPLKSFCKKKLVVAGEAAGCVMPLSGEGIRFSAFGGGIACEPNYRESFMEKFGNNMENSRKMLSAIKKIGDEERIQLLEMIDDPIKMLEGEFPKVTNLLRKPRLLKKLMQIYVQNAD